MKKRKQKSETRLTASILKQDPNTTMVKNANFNGTRQNMQIFRVSPFFQNNTMTVK